MTALIIAALGIAAIILIGAVMHEQTNAAILRRDPPSPGR